MADRSTVPIYYESRISKLSLNAAALLGLDGEFEEITEGEEFMQKEKPWARHWRRIETARHRW